MTTKLASVIVIILAISLILPPASFAQYNNKVTPELPKIPKGAPKIPNANPVNIPEIPNTNSNLSSTMKTLDTIEKLNSLQKTLNAIEDTKKIQNLGTLTVTFENSTLYKKLTCTITAILANDDLDANIALLEKNKTMILDTLKAELSVLTDKEIGWEQESRNVLKSVKKKVNAVAGKSFIDDLLYNSFELTKK